MRLIQNEQLVETFLTNRAHPAFSIRVRARRSNWCTDNLDPLRRKDGIKGSVVLTIVIPNEMSKSLLLCLQVPDELAHLLGYPRVRRM